MVLFLNIFLKNDTILNNIVFGIPEEQLDYDRIQECLRLSNLDDFVNKLPNKLQTEVGEIRLSGGQLQRIGIVKYLQESGIVILMSYKRS